mmetsp:Transcript_12672/g.36451  ORF Transcript_12672/g.36451 Transcript_12672/m.36451 type:complete len:114 (+) Transcript_12672:50-391(+)
MRSLSLVLLLCLLVSRQVHSWSISSFFSSAPSTSEQEEEITAEREKRSTELKHQLEVLMEQLERHNSGVQRISDDRLSSLQKRIAAYEEQWREFSRELSAEEMQDLINSRAEL